MRDKHPTVMTASAYRFLSTRKGAPVCVRCKKSLKIGDLTQHRGAKLYHQGCWLSTFIDSDEAVEITLTKEDLK